MDVNVIASSFRKAMPGKSIARIFTHKGKYIVEAYPENEPKSDRAYCAYYTQDKPGVFVPYTPMNVSIKETEEFFESASKPLKFD